MTTISPMLQSMLNGGVQNPQATNTAYVQQPAVPMNQAPDSFTPSTNADAFAPNPLEGQAIQALPQGTEAAPAQAAEPKKGWKKIALIGAAIVAVAAAIYSSVRKGKAAEGVNTTMEAFKEAGGIFKKGVATSADGSVFNGVISGTTKGGSDYSIKYINGLMQQNLKITTDGVKTLTTATRDADGKLVSLLQQTGDKTHQIAREGGTGKWIKQIVEAATE